MIFANAAIILFDFFGKKSSENTRAINNLFILCF